MGDDARTVVHPSCSYSCKTTSKFVVSPDVPIESHIPSKSCTVLFRRDKELSRIMNRNGKSSLGALLQVSRTLGCYDPGSLKVKNCRYSKTDSCRPLPSGLKVQSYRRQGTCLQKSHCGALAGSSRWKGLSLQLSIDTLNS